MRKKNNQYEYITVYVDDLAIAMKNPKEFTDVLGKKHEFKLKGTRSITFHLRMDFTRDDDGTLCISSTKYIEKRIKNYKTSFGTEPKEYASPLDKGDQSELGYFGTMYYRASIPVPVYDRVPSVDHYYR
jgi:hypothetical protein